MTKEVISRQNKQGQVNTTRGYWENDTLPIPSRRNLHREYAGEVTVYDFCTEKVNTMRNNPLTRVEQINRKKYNYDQNRYCENKEYSLSY